MICDTLLRSIRHHLLQHFTPTGASFETSVKYLRYLSSEWEWLTPSLTGHSASYHSCKYKRLKLRLL